MLVQVRTNNFQNENIHNSSIEKSKESSCLDGRYTLFVDKNRRISSSEETDWRQCCVAPCYAECLLSGGRFEDKYKDENAKVLWPISAWKLARRENLSLNKIQFSV